MWNVVSFEVMRALKKKSFWIASIVPPLIILAIFGVEYYSAQSAKTSGAQQSQASVSSTKIALLDNSGLINPQLLAADHISTTTTEDAGIAGVKSGQLGAFLYYPSDVSTSGIQIYSQDQGIAQTPYDDLATNLLKGSVVNTVNATVKNPQIVQILQTGPPVTDITYKNGVETPGFASIVVPALFALAFLMLIILLGPLMMSSTAEEKENRAAEILLTSVRAQTLIGGKIVALLILGIVQMAVIAVPVIVASLKFPTLIALPGISLSHLPLDPVAITIGALFFAGGFALFMGLIMGVGSLVPGTNASNRFIGIFIIWVYVPLYTLSLVITQPTNLAVTVLTYFPLTAPSMVLLRNALGNISLTQAAISFVIVAISSVLAIIFAVRAFRYGAMEHGRRISLKELLH